MSNAPHVHPTTLRSAIPVILSLVVMLMIGGCGGASPGHGGSCVLDLQDGVTDESAVRAVVYAEGQRVVAQDIDALMALWADGSYVANAKNTPDDPQDDQFWRDKDAIRHRYVRTVFPGAPAAATPADLVITVTGDRAEVRATTQIGSEISPAGDRWTLVKQGSCWLIESLTYNLEPSP